MQNLIERLKRAKNTVFMTGAGISAESGIPTFRDAQTGLWENYKAEELATPQAFAKNPLLVWKWYQWRRQLIEKNSPNAGHKIIARLQNELPGVHLITQNVDGLHQEAGSENVIEFHGNIRNNKCSHCDHVEVNKDNHSDDILQCPNCEVNLRPAVVWFGENIPEFASEESVRLSSQADVFFYVGTSSNVYPAAGLVELAKKNNALIVEINPNSTSLTSSVDYVFAESASAALQRILYETLEAIK